MASAVTIPHLAVPFQFGGDGTAAVVQQDSTDDIAQCVAVLCATTVGQRIELPAYGIPDQTFSRNTDAAAITSAINTWEPRAKVAVTATPGRQAAVTVAVAPAGS